MTTRRSIFNDWRIAGCAAKTLQAATVIFSTVVVYATQPHPGTLVVLCSNGLRSFLAEAAPAFERGGASRLAITYSVSSELAARIRAGEPFDVAILTPPMIDALVQQRFVSAASRTAVARAGMAIAVREGAPKPDVSTVDALKGTLLAARSIAFAREGAGGVFFTALVDRLGLAEALAPKFRPTVTGQDVSRAVQAGEADLGVQPLSEILLVPGVELGGRFPAIVQDYAVMVAGVSTRSTESEAARELIDFLTAPLQDRLLTARGLERVP
jgi:molybdate transport system substrate-binding protein